MKKLLALALLGILLIPQTVVRADIVYDDWFATGSFIIGSTTATTTSFDASNDYTETQNLAGGGSHLSLYGINGQFFWYGYSSGTGTSYLLCVKDIDTNLTSTWGSSEICDDFNGTTISIDELTGGDTVIDPSTGGTSSDTDALNGYAAHDGAVAPNGDIWLTFSGLGSVSAGKYVARVLADAQYQEVEVYDMTFSGEEEGDPMGIAFDLNGDVWVTSYFDFVGSTWGDKVFCLDASNSYQSCTGTAFDSNGGITLGTDTGVLDVVVDESNNLYFAELVGGEVTKLDRQTMTLSSLSVTAPHYLAVDYTNDLLWVSGSNAVLGEQGIVTCIDISGTSMSFGGKCNNQSARYYTDSVDETDDGDEKIAGPIGVDTNGDVWVRQHMGHRMYCFDIEFSSQVDAMDGCKQAGNVHAANGNANYVNETKVINATTYDNSYITMTGSSTDYLGDGDMFGGIIKMIMDTIGGQDTADIYAAVEPAISMTISSTLCQLGTLSTGSVSGCDFDITYTSNSGSGVAFYMKDVTSGGAGLRDGNGNTIDMQDGSCSNGSYTTPQDCENASETWTFPSLTAGTEGAGWSITNLDAVALPSTACSDPQYQNESDCTGNGETWTTGSCPGNGSVQDIGSDQFSIVTGGISGPIWGVVGRTITVNYCFNASISSATPAGSYQHNALFTFTGTF